MNGTVTISLKDYQRISEDLDAQEDLVKKMLTTVPLLEEIEDYLSKTEGHEEVLVKIRKELDKWYA